MGSRTVKGKKEKRRKEEKKKRRKEEKKKRRKEEKKKRRRPLSKQIPRNPKRLPRFARLIQFITFACRDGYVVCNRRFEISEDNQMIK